MKVSKLVLSSYKELLKMDISAFPKAFESTLFPRFNIKTLFQLIEEFVRIVSEEPVLLSLDQELIIVGDIHGNIQDLLRIFGLKGYPPKVKYLFLGDYVDRGEFSIEVIVLLMALKCQYPTSVYLLRGNHELESINKWYGFYKNIMRQYNDEKLWEAFNSAFSYLSLSAVISDTYFCVHGGISPNFQSLESIKLMKKPVVCTEGLVDDLLWSDPSDVSYSFVPNGRGKGVKFGPAASRNFLTSTALKRIIRAHECVQDGISMHDNVITVFSSSNYSINKNKCGILIYSNKVIKTEILPYCVPLERKNISYFDVIPDNGITISQPELTIVKSLIDTNDGSKFGSFHGAVIPGVIKKPNRFRPYSKTPVKVINSRMSLKSLTPVPQANHF